MHAHRENERQKEEKKTQPVEVEVAAMFVDRSVKGKSTCKSVRKERCPPHRRSKAWRKE